MSITVLTIGGVAYNSYASVAEADARLAIDPVRMATWVDLDTSEKEANLVAATYRLDLLTWQGDKTGGALQVNKWPRTGVVYPDGTAVSTSEVPLQVQDATSLLAGSIAISAKVANAGGTGSNIKRAKAGSAEVEFFVGTLGSPDDVPLQDETAFILVGPFLDGSPQSEDTGNLASGVDGESVFCDRDAFGRTRGFP